MWTLLLALASSPARAIDLALEASEAGGATERFVLLDLAPGPARRLLVPGPQGELRLEVRLRPSDTPLARLEVELAQARERRRGRVRYVPLSTPRLTIAPGEQGTIEYEGFRLTLSPQERSSPMTVDLDRLLDFGDPAGSEAAYRALLPQAADEAARLALLTRVARCRGLQKDMDGARLLLAEVEAGLAALPDAHEAAVRLHLERGRVLHSSGDAAGSVPHFQAALARAEAAGLLGLQLDAMHMLGIVTPLEEALSWGHRALERARGSADPGARRWLGPLYNNTGWTLMDLGRPAEALPLFEAGLAVRRERGEVEPIRIARFTVARALRELGRCEEALVELRALRAEWAGSGVDDPDVNAEIAACGG